MYGVRAWIGLVVAGIAAAQSVSPEVLLLARVKAHTRQELARLPNCSCLETVRREHKDQGAAALELRACHVGAVHGPEARKPFVFSGRHRLLVFSIPG